MIEMFTNKTYAFIYLYDISEIKLVLNFKTTLVKKVFNPRPGSNQLTNRMQVSIFLRFQFSNEDCKLVIASYKTVHVS